MFVGRFVMLDGFLFFSFCTRHFRVSLLLILSLPYRLILLIKKTLLHLKFVLIYCADKPAETISKSILQARPTLSRASSGWGLTCIYPG